jgi:hypothetical protein
MGQNPATDVLRLGKGGVYVIGAVLMLLSSAVCWGTDSKVKKTPSWPRS